MSNSNSGGGGGCLALVLLLIFGAALYATNPDEPTIRDNLGQKIPGFTLGSGLGEMLGTAKYHYNNYILFSTMSVTGIDGKERTIAYGYLGQVSVKPITEWQ